MLASKTLGALSYTDPAWNVSKAQFLGANQNSFYVGVEEASPSGVFFKPDGTKMYVLGGSGIDVNEYNLSSAWDISTATYLQNFSVAAQETSPSGVFFKPDGTKMYVIGFSGDDVNEYDLSVAWDISTAVYLQNFSVAAQETFPTGFTFRTDGTKMYVTGNNSNVYQYDLSTAWDVSSASYIQTFSTSAQGSALTAVFFKPDGTKMYVVQRIPDRVYEYTLSTAWDISTSVFLQSFFAGAQDNNPQGLFFKDDGSVLYVLGSATTKSIYQYQLSTAWNISTATYSNPTTKYFSVAAQEIVPLSLFFKPDGTKAYISGGAGVDIIEYNLSSPWAISTATYLQNFSVSAQDSAPYGLFFKPDGTKMYFVGDTGNDVNEYNLSIAWDISTAVYLQVFSVATQETQPRGLFFKPDGTKMYVVGENLDRVNEYDLSTAWDISTAVFLQFKSIGTEGGGPSGLFFKPDGTKMYVVEVVGDDVNEYTLSTPWDVSTASFVRLFSFAPQTLEPTGIFFRDTGLQMYMISIISDAIWEYDLV